jgi:tetratricopeptide (TPR) repeat protein
MDADEALQLVGQLVDISDVLRKREGLQRATEWLGELLERDLLPEQRALAYYFLGNAQADMRRVRMVDEGKETGWSFEGYEADITAFRQALRATGEAATFPTYRRCQILTNLGNLFNHIGRFAEALEYYDMAVAAQPDFPMAVGNKGYALFHYGASLYDQGQFALFWWYAHRLLGRAVELGIEPAARLGFERLRLEIRTRSKPGFLEDDRPVELNAASLGDSQAEQEYRQWCLENRLFLNPLNDLGPYAGAARDIITIKSVVVPVSEGPYYAGFFNQIKQEYVSARYLFFDGIRSTEPHFADRNVLLFNTMDYPVYCLAVEKQRLAFRAAYSILDKVAFFLNHYLALGIPEHRVTFKTLWYEKRAGQKALRAGFASMHNWPLRGLFWLSKDIYEDTPGFRESIRPEARELASIRNHLEHKYLKVHDPLWPGPPDPDDKSGRALADTLAHSIYRDDLAASGLTMLKMARAALIYLSLGVHWEERQRASDRPPDQVNPPMLLDSWEDEWKR